jgi:hypothetical protein
MQFLKIFKRKAKSRIKPSVKKQLNKGRTLKQINAPRRANGQYKRKIPCYYLGKVVNYIYL